MLHTYQPIVSLQRTRSHCTVQSEGFLQQPVMTDQLIKMIELEFC